MDQLLHQPSVSVALVRWRNTNGGPTQYHVVETIIQLRKNTPTPTPHDELIRHEPVKNPSIQLAHTPSVTTLHHHSDDACLYMVSRSLGVVILKLLLQFHRVRLHGFGFSEYDLSASALHLV
ncbi:hypothetical protein PROFUN_07362 [Planoprotostelium fungivorum]|uniref:Uncharacterized protein n=1 Tax=Planoprotostelium fungivorum TaxID=1890364 RepID=A0A2P6NM01_9EUKA|nr:hypothetical protein PROFUN_07362 [Planoprotostelium fungivorum]